MYVVVQVVPLVEQVYLLCLYRSAVGLRDKFRLHYSTASCIADYPSFQDPDRDTDTARHKQQAMVAIILLEYISLSCSQYVQHVIVVLDAIV